MLPPRLNIACGADYREGHWNIDKGPFRVDESVDVFGKLPYQDGTFHAIVANDILEHTSWAHTERVFAEWLRVLAPGGRLTVQVPNLKFLCERYIDGTFDARTASLWIYGGHETSHGVGEENWTLNAHYAGFDSHRLVGLANAFRLSIESIVESGSNLVLTAVKDREGFVFCGERYAYFAHPYNATSMNERTVEVPIIWSEVVRARRLAVLEIGNVVKNYFPSDHIVIDQIKRAPGVLNLDPEDLPGYFGPDLGFDLIVSISMLAQLRNHDKLARTIDALRKTLTKAGRLTFTLPIGFNAAADALLKRSDLSVRYLRRIDSENHWVESDDVDDIRYNDPFPLGNGVAICAAGPY